MHRDPSEIPWTDLGADYIVDSTGIFTDMNGVSYDLNPIPLGDFIFWRNSQLGLVIESLPGVCSK